VGTTAGGFFVEDDGPGIAPGDREWVMESGKTTAAGGTGLGLAIVRKLAEVHGWEVTITESEDGGARFEFEGVETV
jgi:signal transduction histidine kinase